MDEDDFYPVRKHVAKPPDPHRVSNAIAWTVMIALAVALIVGFCVWANSPSSQGVHRFEQETGWQPPDCDTC